MLSSLRSFFLPKSDIPKSEETSLSTISSKVDDSPGWSYSGATLSTRPHDYDPAKVQELYQDALTAWRKNSIAWRIVAITTDYVVGDSFSISSTNRSLNRFISTFWHHPKNRIDLRLESMCDELSRAGDLFVILFLNRLDGMSYIRYITKDQIIRIETAPNDWEVELSYIEQQPDGQERRWLSPDHPDAPTSDSIMLHYSVNRPQGALLGESDLTTMIPWLQRYSRMLEDRVRLHWAVRSFLWLVTVPANKIHEKREQYRIPPDSGAIIVKDETENWQAVTPQVGAADAQHDLHAVRMMIDAGSGYPPHWRGEAADANLATATAMQAPTERHLLRRQQYFSFMLQDILYHAYQRAVSIGRARPLPTSDYTRLFTTNVPDISRNDNESLARAGREIASTFQTAFQFMQAGQTNNQQSTIKNPTFTRLALSLLFKFLGEPQSDETITQILAESSPNDSTDRPSPSSSSGAVDPFDRPSPPASDQDS